MSLRPKRAAAALCLSILSVPAFAQQFDVKQIKGLGSLATSSSVNLSSQASGTLQAGQAPAFSGDMTTSAGSLTTTVSKIGGKAVTLGGALTTTGAFTLGLTLTANTSITLPASGTLATVGGALGTPASVTLTNGTGLPLGTGVTGTLLAAQFPALAGDCTTSAGSLTVACTKTGGVAFGSLATLSAAPAGTLTGATLAASVTASSLTSVGTLGSLTMGGRISFGTGLIGTAGDANVIRVYDSGTGSTSYGIGLSSGQINITSGNNIGFYSSGSQLGLFSGSGLTVAGTITGNGSGLTNIPRAQLAGAGTGVVTALGNAVNGVSGLVQLYTNGALGVGTATPSFELEIHGPSTATALIAGANNAVRFVSSTTLAEIDGVDSTGTAAFNPLYLQGSYLGFSASGYGEAARIDTAGNFGIHNSSPSYPLDVIGTARATTLLGAIGTPGAAAANLKQISLLSYGAYCDGSHTDTTAINNWLAAAAPNVILVAPAGVCLFDAALAVPHANAFTIEGAGAQSTIFRYTGAATNTTLMTVNTTTSGGVFAVILRDFRIDSNTTMTSGYALRLNGLFDSQVTNVALDSANSGGFSSTYGNLCGGFWFNGVGSVDLNEPQAFSKQNCGDGILVNEALGGNAELVIHGGEVGGVPVSASGTNLGFANALHMGGGIGGVRCLSTNFHNSVNGLLVNNDIIANPNREFNQVAGCAFDNMTNYGAYINDAYASGGTMNFGGWTASTFAGPGIYIKKWTNGDVEFNGDKIYNSCGSGVVIEDTTTTVNFSSHVTINNNGNTGAGPACATWISSNPGHGYGVEATTWATKVHGMPVFVGNTAGPFNNYVGMSLATNTPFSPNGQNYTLSNPNGEYQLNLDAASGSPSSVRLSAAGSSKWQVTNSNFGTANSFGILDGANSFVAWLQVVPGLTGGAIIGRGASDRLTVQGPITAANLPTSAGAGGLYVCVDSSGNFYRKASCP